MSDTARIDEWVAGYLKAWASDDPGEIRAIFEPEARYLTAPYRPAHVGHDAIGIAWKPIFDDVTSRFTVEDSFTAGDHVVQRWRYDWGDGHVRGIDVFTVKDGKVTEKIAYVEG